MKRQYLRPQLVLRQPVRDVLQVSNVGDNDVAWRPEWGNQGGE